MILADRLSRFPSRSENLPIELHHNIQHITFTSDKTNIIKGATERDPILYNVYCITHNRWPSRFHEVPNIAHQYWGARDELTIDNGLLLKAERVCIPPELYQRTLHDLHEGHKGIEKMQHLAREKIYWPGLDADITEYVKHCTICMKHKNNSGNTTNDTTRHTRRSMARSSCRLFSSQQHRVYSHRRYI